MSAVSGAPQTMRAGNIAMPEQGERSASPREEIDAAVATVAARRGAWQSLGIAARIELLDRMIADTAAVAARWVQAECERKGIAFDSPTSAEEWALGPWCSLSNLRQLRATLKDIERHGRPQLPGGVRSVGGHVMARICPRDPYDRALYVGLTGEVWMPPPVSATEAQATIGGVYRTGAHRAQVGAVLGAGNVSAIPFMDVLYKLFAEDQVVVLKLNPVTDHLRAVFAEGLGALIDAGYLRIVQGGAEEARYLVYHDAVEAVHMTGSDKTHDAIVFGMGEDALARKAENRPLLAKPITSELGNVTPVIIVPGEWSRSAVRFQAQMLASMLVHGASYECISPRVLITHAGWSGREELLAALRGVLRHAANRLAFYPGAQERFSLFTSAHPEAELLGAGPAGSLPWALITGVDSSGDDPVFTTDPFAPVLSETSIEASSLAQFIDRAVELCNERIWGTLAASVFAHPRSLRAAGAKASLERGIAQLRYGTIALNSPPIYGFSLTSVPWGAFPGHEAADIKSGRGVVHNTYLLSRSQKTVLRSPFQTLPKPVWWITHKHARDVMTRLTGFEAAASPAKMLGVSLQAIRG